MTLLMLAGTICYCVFMALCIDNMAIFKLSKKRNLLSALSLILNGVIVITARHFFHLDTDVRIYLFAFLAGISLTVIYKSVSKAAMLMVCVMAFLFGIEGTALLFLRLLTDSPKHNWIIFLASGAAVFLISQLIKRFFKKHMDINILNNRTMHFLLISAGTALVLIYVNFVIEPPTISLGRWTADFGDITYVLFLVSSAIMFVIIIRYVSRESALRTEMLLTEAFKIYIHDLEKSHNSLRTIKHDYVNILTSLKLYIDGRDMEGLEKYYYEELSELSKDLLSQDRLLGSMKNILLNEIKSILIYKGSVAAQHGIEMGVDAACPVKSLGVSTSIVCQILGILLDNAIEAAEETDEKKLHIAIVIDSRFSTFIIKNSWEKKTIPMNKLFELGFSTKANGRGVGLSTVRSYTEKIKRLYLETELGNDYFTQKLTVEGD